MGEHVRRAPTRKPAPISLIGVIGELLITCAVILGLFAVWQLYWTSYQVEGPRAAAVQSFSQAHAPATNKVGERRIDDPPTVDSAALGSLYGVLHVPSWNWMKIPLGEGIGASVIDNGWAGHYEQTAQAGQVGHFSVAAHRRSYGNSFRLIDLLHEGDKVVVELNDHYVVYTYSSHEIVPADDETNIRVIAPVPGDLSFTQTPTQRIMTMTTCNPEYGNSERYIVHLTFDSWTPKSTGGPAELAQEPAA